MKKRAFTIILAVLLLLGLSACCLKHEYAPATCTAPKTCTKCGKTEGAPLGHTEMTDAAVAPTCTETGLTEGKHCSVCHEVLIAQETVPALGHTEMTDAAVAPTCTETGLTEGKHCSVCHEVLIAQETVPALGHQFAPPTFYKPSVCTVCGATEGEAAGAELFVDALNRKLSFDFGGKKRAEPKAENVAWTVYGLFRNEGRDMIPEGCSLRVAVNTDPVEKKYIAEITLVADEKTSYTLMLGLEGDSMLFWSTAKSAPVYSLNISVVKEWLAQNGVAGLMPVSIGVSPEIIRNVLIRYERIFFENLANAHTVSETECEYKLEALDASVFCHVLTFAPARSDWKNALAAFAGAAQEDEELFSFLRYIFMISYANDSASGKAKGTEKEYIDEMTQKYRDLLAGMPENAGSFLDAMENIRFEFAYGNKRQYAAKIFNAEEGFGFESLAIPKERYADALIHYTASGEAGTQILAKNQIDMKDGAGKGVLTVEDKNVADYSFIFTEDRKFLNITITDSVNIVLEKEKDKTMSFGVMEKSGTMGRIDIVKDETVPVLSVPEQERVSIRSMEEFTEAVQNTVTGMILAGMY